MTDAHLRGLRNCWITGLHGQVLDDNIALVTVSLVFEE